MRQEGESRKLISTSRVEEPIFAYTKVSCWAQQAHLILPQARQVACGEKLFWAADIVQVRVRFWSQLICFE